MTLRELLEQRAALVTEMRSYTSTPAGESGDLSAEQSQKFETAKAKLEGVEKNIERQKLLDEAERRMQGTPITGTGDTRFDEELRKFSLVKAIAMQVPDLAQRIDCGREREISSELAKRSGMQFQGAPCPMQVFETRVLTTALPVGGPGSNLISTDHLGNQFIDRLRAALVIRKLGARILTGLVGNVEIPKRIGSSGSAWVAENAAIGLSDPEFGKVTMTPKHVGSRTEFSRNMLLQSSPDIEDLVRDDFAQVLAEAVDSAAIDGGGSNEPVGILSTPGLDTSVSLSTPTWAKVLELIEIVQNENSEGSAFLTDPSTVKILRSTEKVSGTGMYIMDGPNSLAGYPLFTSTLVPRGPTSPASDHVLIFGKWSDLLLGYWSTFDLLVNPYESTAYSKGNVQVRGIITADVAVRHIESFAASINV